MSCLYSFSRFKIMVSELQAREPAVKIGMFILSRTGSRAPNQGLPKVAAQKASPRWENTMAVKDGKACKIHQTGGSTSVLDPTEKLCVVAQTAAKTHLLDGHLPDGKTPWQWRTERRARSTKPEAWRPFWIRQRSFVSYRSPNCSQNTPAGWENNMAVKDPKACKIHQTGGQTSLLDPTEKLWIVAKLSQNTPAGWENTMAVKDGKACKTHQTGGFTSLLDPTAKLWITAQAAARTHLPNVKCS